MVTPCPSCGAERETPLCCASCGTLFPVDGESGVSADPYDLLGLPRTYAVDGKQLKRRLLDLTRRMHPDFFGTADADTRALAERNTAMVNEAHEELSDDLRRADGIVRRLGGPDENTERQMPQEFLMEVLEWNEALEEERSKDAPSPALDDLESALNARRTATLADVAQLLEPLPERDSPMLTEVRRHLNGLRYLQKTLAEIGALRLDQANSH